MSSSPNRDIDTTCVPIENGVALDWLGQVTMNTSRSMEEPLF